MKVLFISGNEGAGKSPTCKALDRVFEQKFEYQPNYTLEFGNNLIDFFKVYSGKTKTNRPVTIVLNTACDLLEIIVRVIIELEQILNDFSDNDIIVITAIRNGGDKLRELLETKLKELLPNIEIIEIPLSRVNERSNDDVHNWYHKKVDELIIHTLKNPPFEIF